MSMSSVQLGPSSEGLCPLQRLLEVASVIPCDLWAPQQLPLTAGKRPLLSLGFPISPAPLSAGPPPRVLPSGGEKTLALGSFAAEIKISVRDAIIFKEQQ